MEPLAIGANPIIQARRPIIIEIINTQRSKKMKIKQISFTLLKAIDHSFDEYCETLMVIAVMYHM